MCVSMYVQMCVCVFGVRSIVLASGTLSPMDSWSVEMQVPFQACMYVCVCVYICVCVCTCVCVVVEVLSS